MAKQRDRRGLGRGLSALMAEADIAPATAEPTSSGGIAQSRPEREIPVESIRPNPDQPRRHFSEDALADLAASISEKGIIQPLIVRPDPTDDGSYQIVAGERRWRAAQLAQLHTVPVVVRNFDDTEVLEVAIIENIQRTDLNPIEEAQGYRQLIDRFGHTQEQLSQAMGKSRSHLANVMRLLQLPDEVQSMLVDGRLSAGHARALITADDPVGLARKAVSAGMSVREVERAAKTASGDGGQAQRPAARSKDADTIALERDLTASIGMKVSIDHDQGSGSGKLTINYKDLGQLDDLMRVLSSS
ncbi:ParB/RepB/Spo0J family partition protein [Gymnodinialimonas sp. 2305UL16-5]|uniref:ParB/RepB/Spo0J family partition protein n=1 Tax=Gymnodinialimonas mytili TaxID=3126503 RepID=UPI0030A40DB1